MNRNMAGLDVLLEPIEDGEAGLIRQANVENDRVGHELLGQAQGLLGRSRDQGAKPHFAGQITQDGGEAVVVLNDQQDALRVGKRVSVILDFAWRPWLRGAGLVLARKLRDSGDARWFAQRDLCRVVRYGDRDRECASLP